MWLQWLLDWAGDRVGILMWRVRRARLAAIRERKVPAIREDPVYAEAAPEDRPKVIHRLQEAARRDDPRLYIRTAYGDW